MLLNVKIIDKQDSFLYVHSSVLKKFTKSRNGVIAVQISTLDYSKKCYGSFSDSWYDANGPHCLNVSAKYAETHGLSDDTSVYVYVIEDTRAVTIVCVEPLSEEDRNILEIECEQVCDTLLNQIRVVQRNQIIPVWINKSIVIFLKICSLDNSEHIGIMSPDYTEVHVIQNDETGHYKNISLPVSSERNDAKPVIEIPKPEMVSAESGEYFWNILLKSVLGSAPIGKLDVISKVDTVRNDLLKECVGCDVGTFRFVSSPRNTRFDSESNIDGINSKCEAFLNLNFIPEHFRSKFKNREFMFAELRTLLRETKDDKNEGSKMEGTSDLLDNPVCVRLSFLEDDYSGLNAWQYFPTLFASKEVAKLLNINNGAKVNLRLLQNIPTYHNVKIEVFHEFDSYEVRNINYFYYIVKYVKEMSKDRIILNNGSSLVVPVENIDYEFVLSLKPEKLPYAIFDVENFSEALFSLSNVQPTFSRNMDNRANQQLGSDEPSHFIETDAKITSQVVRLFSSNRWLFDPHIYSQIVSHNHAIIIGDTGSGKSTIVAKLSAELSDHPFYAHVEIIKCGTLHGKSTVSIAKVFQSALSKCAYYQPSVLIIDDIHVLCAIWVKNMPEQTKNQPSNRTAEAIVKLLLSYSSHHISVVATAADEELLHDLIYADRGPSFFTNIFKIPLPSDGDKKILFKALLESKCLLQCLDAHFLDVIVGKMNGFRLRDVFNLSNRIAFKCISTFPEDSGFAECKITNEIIEDVFENFTPICYRATGIIKSTALCWDDVGGLNSAKQRLTEVLLWPIKYPEIFARCPLKIQNGILLYGLPGCGKTILAGAVANEAGCNLISVKGPELISKYVGATEESVRNIFEQARNARPCILFFDEFESFSPRRGNNLGNTDTIVNQLLTELDGIDEVSGVWVIAGTSRPDLIDPAVLRPGRLGTYIQCPMPGKNDRYEILKIASKRISLADGVNLREIAEKTIGYTGADLKAILYNAQTMAIKCNQSHCYSEQLKQITNKLHSTSNSSAIPKGLVSVDQETLLQALDDTFPSLNQDRLQEYEKIYAKFSNRDLAMDTEFVSQKFSFA